jgi:hypothetical protein
VTGNAGKVYKKMTPWWMAEFYFVELVFLFLSTTSCVDMSVWLLLLGSNSSPLGEL